MNRLSSQSIFTPRYLALSIGIILAAMTIGFEGLAVTTVAPAIAGDLQGIHLFGWIFSAYLLAQIVGTLVIGRQIDRRGPAQLFTIAIILFAIGLIVAAIASNMYVLIASRALQGFGAGAMYTCIYTAISLSYPDELRAKILGALGTAYVLPSMLGPYVAGLIASQWSWRFVFWGVLPFLLLAVVLSLLQFADSFTPGVAVGIGGAIIAISQTAAVSMEAAITLAMVFNIALVLLSLIANARTKRTPSETYRSQERAVLNHVQKN